MLVRIFSGYDCHWQTIASLRLITFAHFQFRIRLPVLHTGLFRAFVVYAYMLYACTYVMFIRCDRRTSNNKHKKRSRNDVQLVSDDRFR